MKKTIVWSVLLILTLLSSRSEAQSTDDVARQLSGMWRLVSNPQRLADGTTRQGTNGVPNIGYAFFDTTGSHMCFLMMTPNRPVWAGAAPTPEEGLTALRGINAYCATLEIHAKEGFMDRRYDINQNPNAVGRATRRWYTFQGPDRMTLRVDAAELADPAHLDLKNLGGAGPLVNLPLKVKLDNLLLGNACFIGSSSEPVTLNLTDGTTNPDLPNFRCRPAGGDRHPWVVWRATSRRALRAKRFVRNPRHNQY